MITEPFCGWCSKPLLTNYKKCVDCNRELPIIKTYAASIYLLPDKKDPKSKIYHDNYPVNKEIWQLKNIGNSAAENLGECMVFMINNSYQYLKSFDLLVAAPQSNESRGFNQASLLAKNISDRINIPFSDILFKRIPSAPQHQTSYEKKGINVNNLYDCSTPVDGLKIIIIDDVYTTGSTMNNCAKALFSCGAKEVRGFVMGRSTDVRNIKYIKQEEKYDIYQGRSKDG